MIYFWFPVYIYIDLLSIMKNIVRLNVILFTCWRFLCIKNLKIIIDDFSFDFCQFREQRNIMISEE